MRSARIFAICAVFLLGSAAIAAQVDIRATVDSTPGELRSYAAARSIGIEWDLAGDTDHDALCRVQYRVQGTDEWKQALPLFRIDYSWWYATEKADTPSNLFGGSILFLQPGTTYEVNLSLADPDGADSTTVLSVRTQPLPRLPVGGRTFHLVPGSGGGSGAANDPFKGFLAAQAAARPGDIVLLHQGSYGRVAFGASGTEDRYIVWKGAGDGDVVLSGIAVAASHVWLEGLRVEKALDGQPHPEQERVDDYGVSGTTGLTASGPAVDVVISRNSFAGFHYSVLLNNESRDWHIADNVIVGDNDPLSGGISGEGIELNHSSDHTVAHNSISHVADGISYPGRNCDIYGNDIFDVSDDGLEPDYGYANNRMWGNRITNYKNNALSFQPMCCGPWYIIRNQIIAGNSESEIFKFRVQDRFLLANNTFVQWNYLGTRMHHLLTSLSRNNLYISAGGESPLWIAIDCNQPQYCLPDNYAPNWMTDVDYDGFDWGTAAQAIRWANSAHYSDLRGFSEAVGIEEHAIRVHKEEIFQTYDIPATPGRVVPQHLALRQGCNAIDAGVVLPNINDDFAGNAPDLGACEYGAPVPHYGPRD